MIRHLLNARLANLVFIRGSPKPLAATTALYVVFLDVVSNILEHYVAIAQPKCVKVLALLVPEEVSHKHITDGVHIRVNSVQLTSNGCTEECIVLLVGTVGQRQVLSGVKIFEFLNDARVNRNDGISHQYLIIELPEVGSRKAHSLIGDNVKQLVDDAVIAWFYLFPGFVFSVNEELGWLIVGAGFNGFINIMWADGLLQCFCVPIYTISFEIL